MSRQPKQETRGSLFKRELLAILFLAIGFFIYLSLFSFHPQDPSFFSHSPRLPIQNWGGILGAYLSDFLIFVFGAGAYFLGIYFLLVSVLLLVGIRPKIYFLDLPVYLLTIIFIGILFQLTQENLYFTNYQIEAGGLFGSILADVGITYLGRPGTFLMVIFGALLTFVWATRVSLQESGQWLSRITKPVLKGFFGQSVIFYARSKKLFSKLLSSIQLKLPVKRYDVKIHSSPKLASAHPAEDISVNTSLVALSAKSAPSFSLQGPKILDRIDKKKPKPASSQLDLHPIILKGYQLPPLHLLNAESQDPVRVDEMSLKMNARILEKKLRDFNVEGQVTEIHPGPVITMYEFQPAPGVKLSRIASLVDDLCLAMGGRQVRIVAPLPNKPAVGIEIPNNQREMVVLKDIIADEKFEKNESRLILALGKDIEGIPFVADLAKMPHLLVAGATGAGKSVSINSMIISMLYKATPEEIRLIMVDPKMLELSIYEGIPHLLLPVVTEPKKAALALRWAVREMERRYKLLADVNARNITNYNRKIEKGDFVSRQAELGASAEATLDEDAIRHEGKIPYIVILIDELADLMMVSSREVEESITRLAQMARAAGIHLILATQRPSVDVLTGVIKANFPARISFKVSSKHDARTILDTIGSERLLGSGDMLFIPPGVSKMLRVHGAYVSESEVGRVVEFLKKQAEPVYNESILKPIEIEEGGLDGSSDEGADELYDQAVSIVAETRQASISMVQRKLRVGYNRAARMIEKMEQDGIVSAPSSQGHRQVLVSSFEAAQ